MDIDSAAAHLVLSSLEQSNWQIEASPINAHSYILVREHPDDPYIRLSFSAAGYINASDGKRPDLISFESPHICDLHIFCLFKGMSADSSFLDKSSWEFFIASDCSLYIGMPYIPLKAVERLCIVQCDFSSLAYTLQKIMAAQ